MDSDLMMGVYGGNVVVMLYGAPIMYAEDNWPKPDYVGHTNDAEAAI